MSAREAATETRVGRLFSLPLRSLAENLRGLREFFAGNSHSHRGFSPVDSRFLEIKENRFNGFFWQANKIAASRKPLKTVPDFGALRYHRAKATV
jgi:hypothetical protein